MAGTAALLLAVGGAACGPGEVPADASVDGSTSAADASRGPDAATPRCDAVGFAPPVEWALPYDGGESFPQFGDRNSTTPNYAILDLTGDARPDLVVTEGVGTDTARWQVFAGSDAGFSSTAISWALPDFGTTPADSRGWLVELTDRFTDGLNYGVADMNGDGAPDLIVTARDRDVLAGPDAIGLGSSVWLVFAGACAD